MFMPGDLVWIPQESILLQQEPQSPHMIKIVQKPEVGLYIRESNDRDFVVIHCEGQEWVTNRKHIKLMRNNNVNKVS